MNYYILSQTLRCLVFFFCTCSCPWAQGKLIFAIDLVRHGDRTPLISSPGIEKIGLKGLGELTPKGMRQEFDLGKALRQRYVTQDHLLPEHYNPKVVMVRSTDLSRTLMSAQSILLGLYPLGTGPSLSDGTKALPEGFQSIPIHTVSPEQDNLLLPNHDKAKYQQLLETYILNSPDWLKKDRELESNYSEWGRVFKIKINGLLDLISLGDRLFIESLYDISPPDGLPKKDINTIIDAGKWAFLRIINHSEFGSNFGIELAEKIKSELNSAIQENRPLKYLLFVAHDTTLSAQLKILGQTIDDTLPYASNINYSLFDMGSSHYEVRVTYNQKPLFIERCGGYSCALSEFLN